MIRLVYAMRRLSHLSLAEFHRYWHDIHGPRVVENAPALAVNRYIQVHRIEDPNDKASRDARGMLEPYDGVTEIWWDDQQAAFEALNTPEGQAANREILEDEGNFVDFSRSSLWLATDIPQVNPTPENIIATADSSITKFYYVLGRLASLTREAFQLYWRMNHGPLIRSLAADMRVLRYLQVHTLDDSVLEPFRQSRGQMEDPYDGHAELWFDSNERSVSSESPKRQRASQLAAEDEARFIEFTRSSYWKGKEYVLLERSSP